MRTADILVPLPADRAKPLTPPRAATFVSMTQMVCPGSLRRKSIPSMVPQPGNSGVDRLYWAMYKDIPRLDIRPIVRYT